MHIVIIGNGIAGVTAARFIRKLSDHRITIVSGESDHFFSRTALMYIYMGHMRFEDTKPYEDWFWEKNRIELRRAWIQVVDTENKSLQTADGDTIGYDKLILACGSTPNKFGWPGQDLKNVGGMVSLQDLARMEAASKDLDRAVVVGGGLIGIEMAEMFHSRHIPVTMLVREDSYWSGVLPPEESAMVNRQIKQHGIDLRLGAELESIDDNGFGSVASVTTKDGVSIPCGFVGLTAGVHPTIKWLTGSGIETDKGILVDRHLQTNIPDVYAVGDCMELREPPPARRAIEAVWYVGRMSGETVAYNVCGKPVAYDPGIWFNSAKFIDLEYQVYGDLKAKRDEGIDTFYWEHPKGEKSVRIDFEAESQSVIGFNLMGIRYRHEVCDRWLREKTPIQEVIPHLGLANFDPEFYREHEPEIVAAFNRQTGSNLQLKTRRGLGKVLSFLRGRSVSSRDRLVKR